MCYFKQISCERYSHTKNILLSLYVIIYNYNKGRQIYTSFFRKMQIINVSFFTHNRFKYIEKVNVNIKLAHKMYFIIGCKVFYL